MSYDPQKFVNTGQFGDWSSYARFGDTDQMKSLSEIGKQAMGMPVDGASAPPESFGDLAKEAISPYQQKFNNLSNAATQLGEGNVFNAYRASQGKSFNPDPQPAQSQKHIYDDGW